MIDVERQRPRQRTLEACVVLTRRARDKVDTDICEPCGARSAAKIDRIVGAMGAAQPVQLAIVKRLDANRKPIHSRRPPNFEVILIASGICLERALDASG